MAEITKITTPLMPRENVSGKYKPDTDQAFELTDTSKVHKPADGSKIADQNRPEGQALRDSMGRAAIEAILRDSGDLMEVVRRLALLVETGVSASKEMTSPGTKALLDSLFINREALLESITQQDKASVLFKGGTFDALRDLLSRFEGNPRVNAALGNLLKIFEHNVNSGSSIKSILLTCDNILDYMFKNDRDQFSGYLANLAKMLLPDGDEARPAQNAQNSQNAQNAQNPQVPQNAQNPQTPQTAQNPQVPQTAQDTQATQNPQTAQNPQVPQNTQNPQTPPSGEQARTDQSANTPATPQQPAAASTSRQPVEQQAPQLSPKEAAQVLKGNLLPLLGEIVVKYNQNERIRDHVMVVVHNIVRVDQGTPESLREAVNNLAHELRKYANLPENFSDNLLSSLSKNVKDARDAQNEVFSKLTDLVSDALRSESSAPAVVRQAENLMISLLQNQSPMMNLLHFILPFQTRDDQIFAELYVDPDSQETASKRSGKESRKFFLSFESEKHGSYEMSFVQTGEYVDFSMWCPANLVKSLSGMKRYIGDIMQTYGYTMNSFQIDEMNRQKSIVEVFPHLLNKRVGIDVRI